MLGIETKIKIPIKILTEIITELQLIHRPPNFQKNDKNVAKIVNCDPEFHISAFKGKIGGILVANTNNAELR